MHGETLLEVATMPDAVHGRLGRHVRHPATKREMLLYHATTPKKAQRYRASGRIIAPVRGFTTLEAAMAWACKTGRSVVLQVQGEDCHKLPDHHNAFGEAWWVDHDVLAWTCVFSPKDA
jgi:hypothetical protein